MIPYGAEIFDHPDPSILERYALAENGYCMLVARMEPENNVEMILDGYIQSGANEPFVVVGNQANDYGSRLCRKFEGSNIRFVGGIYDVNMLNNLRYHARAYFHGHSVGGTNPSLLEAMASQAMIAAHDNIFNRSILGDDAFYFSSAHDVAVIIMDDKALETIRPQRIRANLQKIRDTYRWDVIVRQYADLIERVMSKRTDYYAG